MAVRQGALAVGVGGGGARGHGHLEGGSGWGGSYVIGRNGCELSLAELRGQPGALRLALRQCLLHRVTVPGGAPGAARDGPRAPGSGRRCPRTRCRPRSHGRRWAGRGLRDRIEQAAELRGDALRRVREERLDVEAVVGRARRRSCPRRRWLPATESALAAPPEPVPVDTPMSAILSRRPRPSVAHRAAQLRRATPRAADRRRRALAGAPCPSSRSDALLGQLGRMESIVELYWSTNAWTLLLIVAGSGAG